MDAFRESCNLQWMMLENADPRLCKEAMHSRRMEQIPVPSFRTTGIPAPILHPANAFLDRLPDVLEVHFLGLVFTGYIPLATGRVEEMVTMVSETVSETWLSDFHTLRTHIRESTNVRRQTIFMEDPASGIAPAASEIHRLASLTKEAVTIVVHRVRELWKLFLEVIETAEPQPLAWTSFEVLYSYVDSKMSLECTFKTTGILLLAVFLYDMESWYDDFMHSSECACLSATRFLNNIAKFAPQPVVDFWDCTEVTTMEDCANVVSTLCCISKGDAADMIVRNSLCSRLGKQSLFGVVHRALSCADLVGLNKLDVHAGILPKHMMDAVLDTRRMLRKAYNNAFSSKWILNAGGLSKLELLSLLNTACLFVLPWAVRHVKKWSNKLAKRVVHRILVVRGVLDPSDSYSGGADSGDHSKAKNIYRQLAVSMVVVPSEASLPVSIDLLPLLSHIRSLHQRPSERRPIIITQPTADPVRYDFEMKSVNMAVRYLVFGCMNPYDSDTIGNHGTASVADVGACMLNSPDKHLVACAAALVWRSTEALTRQLARVPVYESPKGRPCRKRSLTFQCSICFEDGATSQCACDHCYCNGCAVRLLTDRVLSSLVDSRVGSYADDATPFMGKDVFACAFPDCTNRLEWAMDLLPSETKFFARQLQNKIRQDDVLAAGGTACAVCDHAYMALEHERIGGVAKCPECCFQTCLRCVGVFHPGKVCPAALRSNEITPHTLLTEAKIQRCPNVKCGIATTKSGGCNHMMCDKCRTDWCWSCGLAIHDTIAKHYENSKTCFHFHYSPGSEMRRIELYISSKPDVAEDVRTEAMALLHTTFRQNTNDL